MSHQYTTVADRHRMIDLKLQGATLKEAAAQTGWSCVCVRKWWRRYRDGGRPALAPADGRQQRGGRMSSFDPVVRFACLRLKKEHPAWGADVVRARLAAQLALPLVSLPSPSTIEKYWSQFRGRLYTPHYPRPPQLAPPDRPPVREVHERWQADFKEAQVAGLGRVVVFNIRDEASPVCIGSYVFWPRQVDGQAVQDVLRAAFAQWGLPDRFQTDHDTRLVNNCPSPFPTYFTLWLAGLGIAHDLAPSAQANGCTERLHRTWHERVVIGREFDELAALQAVSEEELWWMNHKLPSRGRACAGEPPLVVYPEALNARRAYHADRELQYFSLPRVYDYLASQTWWRRVSQVGQFSLGAQVYSVGSAHARQQVCITFDAQTTEFVVSDDQQQPLTRLAPKGLTIAAITGLENAD